MTPSRNGAKPPNLAAMDQLPGEPESLDLFMRDNAACMDNLLQVITELLGAYGDLLEVVDGLSHELAATTAQVAALQAERDGAPAGEPAAALGADAAHTLRQAAALAQRAGIIVARSRGIEADAWPRAPLRGVDGNANASPRRAAG
jgi:hypothetical protein